MIPSIIKSKKDRRLSRSVYIYLTFHLLVNATEVMQIRNLLPEKTSVLDESFKKMVHCGTQWSHDDKTATSCFLSNF